MAVSLSYSLPMPRIHTLSHNLPRPRFLHLQRASMNQQLSTQQIYSRPHPRRSANHRPTIWSYDFLQSLQTDDMGEEHEIRIKKLQKEVTSMINNETTDLLTILQLIDDIQRLGLGYRFENDIRTALDRIILSWEEYDDHVEAENRLHAAALRFRLLRQQGYHISQDVFKIFLDHNGNFKASLLTDIKGIVSLYEASYLAFEGEKLMEEAQTFTRNYLSEVKKNLDTNVSELVSHVVDLPLHHRVQRLEAWWYIEAYSKRNDANYSLIELSQLDFNRVQSIYQGDLKLMSRWWKDIDLANKLIFARDRLMECFFCTVGMVPEPQFNDCRIGLTKVAAFITLIDDIYDVYGTLDELELFTDAVERWDLNCVDGLPEYMKSCFLALYNTINEMAYETLKSQGATVIPYLTKVWADMCKAFLQEAKWSDKKYTPTFEELAREEIHNLIDKTWKKMNKHRMDKHPFGERFIETVINLARISHCHYQHGDGHGDPDARAIKGVRALIIDPICAETQGFKF